MQLLRFQERASSNAEIDNADIHGWTNKRQLESIQQKSFHLDSSGCNTNHCSEQQTHHHSDLSEHEY